MSDDPKTTKTSTEFELGYWSAISSVLGLFDARNTRKVNKLDLYMAIQKLRTAEAKEVPHAG